MKNVYIDTSEIENFLYPSEMKTLLRLWLETYPEKITFGSDAYPFSDALGSEETYWLGVYTARDALAAALAEIGRFEGGNRAQGDGNGAGLSA
jgi:uncharacterized protein